MQVCFIGHRTIQKNKELISSLNQTIIDLINKGATTFIFGSMSEFDGLSWETVTTLKANYPFIKRVYVRSAYQYIDKSYEKYLLESYEETYFPTKLANAGKSSYVERNYEMIDASTYCVFYYNENYIPAIDQQAKHNMLLQSKRNSGTKIAYNYALKRNKTIINLYRQFKDKTL
ncbi:MAG: hypothetical protein J6Q15_01955 [Clostridia bacterium]|nr:hypothetical protein [Clostridia bacterium]